VCFFPAIKKFLAEEDGPTAVEYAVLLMLILMTVIATVQVIGGALDESFQESSDQLVSATGP